MTPPNSTGEGDSVMAIAYWTIASELRNLAAHFDGTMES